MKSLFTIMTNLRGDTGLSQKQRQDLISAQTLASKAQMNGAIIFSLERLISSSWCTISWWRRGLRAPVRRVFQLRCVWGRKHKQICLFLIPCLKWVGRTKRQEGCAVKPSRVPLHRLCRCGKRRYDQLSTAIAKILFCGATNSYSVSRNDARESNPNR